MDQGEALPPYGIQNVLNAVNEDEELQYHMEIDQHQVPNMAMDAGHADVPEIPENVQHGQGNLPNSIFRPVEENAQTPPPYIYISCR